MGLAYLVCPRIRIDCMSAILDTILDGTLHSCTPTEDTSVFQGEYDIFHAPNQRALAALIDHGAFSPVSPVANSTGGSTINPVISDTGASLAISPDPEDFVDTPKLLARPLTLGGMAQGMSVEGTGIVSWTSTADDGSEIEVRTHAYYVPKAAARLLSPQRLLNKKTGIFGKFPGDEDLFSIYLNDNSAISTSNDVRSGLPIANAYCGTKVQPSVNLKILDEENQNLTACQKLLLEWHYKFGHLNF
jgi:hypothetical protein